MFSHFLAFGRVRFLLEIPIRKIIKQTLNEYLNLLTVLQTLRKPAGFRSGQSWKVQRQQPDRTKRVVLGRKV